MLIATLAASAALQSPAAGWREVYRHDLPAPGAFVLSYDPASVRRPRRGLVRVSVRSQVRAGSDSLPTLIQRHEVELDCRTRDGRVLGSAHRGLSDAFVDSADGLGPALAAAICR